MQSAGSEQKPWLWGLRGCGWAPGWATPLPRAFLCVYWFSAGLRNLQRKPEPLPTSAVKLHLRSYPHGGQMRGRTGCPHGEGRPQPVLQLWWRSLLCVLRGVPERLPLTLGLPRPSQPCSTLAHSQKGASAVIRRNENWRGGTVGLPRLGGGAPSGGYCGSESRCTGLSRDVTPWGADGLFKGDWALLTLEGSNPESCWGRVPAALPPVRKPGRESR